MGEDIKLNTDDWRSCATGQWIIRPVETQYIIQLKESDGVTGIVIPAERAEIKDEHLILYKNDSIVYFCPIERIDNFNARQV